MSTKCSTPRTSTNTPWQQTRGFTTPWLSDSEPSSDEELDHVFGSSLGSLDMDWTVLSTAWSKITLRPALVDSARDDKDLAETLDDIRRRGNWGYLAFTDHSRLELYQSLDASKAASSPACPRRTDNDDGLDLASQVAQWPFAFDAAATAATAALSGFGFARRPPGAPTDVTLGSSSSSGPSLEPHRHHGYNSRSDSDRRSPIHQGRIPQEL
ncbi:hypothetical protein QBC42DRAFT_283530 [Cladorrhinum samala]|uniref:Uncharacterized protein n=1 Tax=Cladorrhinum samala TaxID=585594 RepID=A0AAV9HX05_9PEZI|nr:hypothetical protein QBC42DRAFT_283530 [Cladorrhinum samala]